MTEPIATVIPLVRKPKSFGRSDTYTLVVTNTRMIFAELTGDMVKQAIAEAQKKGKEEGKGFLSRWADQIKASIHYADRYWQMSPDEVLAENAKNFAIPNSSVKLVKAKTKHQGDPDDPGRSYVELKIESSAGKYEFRVDGSNDKAIREALQGIFGDIVRK